jgi:uncharacterized protein YbcI
MAGSTRGTTIATEPTKTEGELSREISREMVGLIKKYVGRGPTYARTYIHNDIVLTMLHDTMTTAEETLKQQGEDDRVRELRHMFQGAFRPEAIAVVERAVGRRVVAFLSDHAVDPDWAIEAFVLEHEAES